MLRYEKTDVSEVIDIDKTDASKECMFCHYWYFKDGLKIESNLCDNCYGTLIIAYNSKCLAVLNLRVLITDGFYGVLKMKL